MGNLIDMDKLKLIDAEAISDLSSYAIFKIVAVFFVIWF